MCQKIIEGDWVDLLKSEVCRRLSGNSNSAFRVISRPELNFVDKKTGSGRGGQNAKKAKIPKRSKYQKGQNAKIPKRPKYQKCKNTKNAKIPKMQKYQKCKNTKKAKTKNAEIPKMSKCHRGQNI